MNQASIAPWEIANRLARSLFLLAAIPVVWLAFYFGLVHSLLLLILLVMVPRTLVTRGILLWRKRLAIGWWRRALKKEGRIFAVQFVLRVSFWIIAAVALTWTISPVDFERSEYGTLLGTVWGLALALVILDAFPSAEVRVTTLMAFGVGTLGLAFQLAMFRLDPADAVVLDRPVRGDWYVTSGGRSSLFNHHYGLSEQRHAVDLVKAQDRTFRGDRAKLESYFAWDQDILAPADGVVVKAIDDRKDEAIGESDTENPEGNAIVLRIAENRFVFMAHLMKGNLRVVEGESVKAGHVLAKCGNSGNTSEPHLHLQVQSHESVWHSTNRTFPMRFKNGVGYLRRNDRPDFGN